MCLAPGVLYGNRTGLVVCGFPGERVRRVPKRGGGVGPVVGGAAMVGFLGVLGGIGGCWGYVMWGLGGSRSAR